MVEKFTSLSGCGWIISVLLATRSAGQHMVNDVRYEFDSCASLTTSSASTCSAAKTPRGREQ